MSEQAPIQRPPAMNQFGNMAATLAVIIAVLVLPWQLFHDGAWNTFMTHWWNGTTGTFTQSWKDYGNLVQEVAPAGNVVVIYKGFDLANSAHITYAAQSHFLGALQLYPRRIFTADEKAVINKGSDVINPFFSPEISWLQQNQVRTAAGFNMVGQNQLQVSSEAIPSATPIQGGR